MIELTPAKFRLKPYRHQLDGVKALIKSPVFGLFDEPGAGKTKQVIDAACTLYEAGTVDTVVIACPAQVKSVWLDQDLGEIQKHAFLKEYNSFDYCSKRETLLPYLKNEVLTFIVVSYEFLRQENQHGDFPKVDALLQLLKSRRAWLVCDEGSALGNWKSLQTKAVLALRAGCQRVTILDGTPAGNSPLELYSKFKILDPKILGYRNFWHFRANHAVLNKRSFGGPAFKQVVGYQNLELLAEKTAPYCLRREKKDCLDLPAKLPPTFITAALTEKTWKHYTTMRDELIAELDDSKLLVQHAAVKILRLAQICAGFLGGFTNELTEESETKELSCETTNALLEWLDLRLAENPKFKAVVWCRWRPEIDRLIRKLRKYPCQVASIYGGVQENIEALHPDDPSDGPVVLVGQPQAAKFGLNFAKAASMVYLSQDYNLVTRKQSEDRIHRPGQVLPCSFLDVLVTGPSGQKTVTWDIRKVLTEKEDVARRTTAQWRRVLTEE